MHGSDARSVAEAVAAEAAAEAVAVVAAAARRPYYTLASSTSGRLLGRAVRQSRYVLSSAPSCRQNALGCGCVLLWFGVQAITAKSGAKIDISRDAKDGVVPITVTGSPDMLKSGIAMKLLTISSPAAQLQFQAYSHTECWLSFARCAVRMQIEKLTGQKC